MNKELRIKSKILIGLGIVAVFIFVGGISKIKTGFSPIGLIYQQQSDIETQQDNNKADDIPSGLWQLVAPAEAKEIVEMRTRNSKTWFLGSEPDGNGKYMWRGSIGDIHYKNNPDDPNESWKNINTNITRIKNDELGIKNGYDYEMIEAGYKVYLKDNFNEGEIVRYEKDGEWLEIEPGPLNWTGYRLQSAEKMEQLISESRDAVGSPIPDKPSHIYWSNAYGGKLDFEMIIQPTRLVKYLIIENFNHLQPLEQLLAMDAKNIELELNLGFEYSGGLKMEQKKDALEFQNSKGEILWQFMKPEFWDSSEPRKEGVSNFNLSPVTCGPSPATCNLLSVRVPYAWLKQATFPVYVDPTFNVGESAGDSMDRSTDNGTFPTIAWVGVGSSTADANEGWGGLRFTSVNITQGSTINSAYVSVFPFSTAADDPSTDIGLENVDNGANFGSGSVLIHDRTFTAAQTDWEAVGVYTGSYVDSPSIVGAVQEVINRAGWVSGNALNVLFEGDLAQGGAGFRFDSYDKVGGNPASLTITWTEPSTYQPRPPGVSPSGGGFLIF